NRRPKFARESRMTNTRITPPSRRAHSRQSQAHLSPGVSLSEGRFRAGIRAPRPIRQHRGLGRKRNGSVLAPARKTRRVDSSLQIGRWLELDRSRLGPDQDERQNLSRLGREFLEQLEAYHLYF